MGKVVDETITALGVTVVLDTLLVSVVILLVDTAIVDGLAAVAFGTILVLVTEVLLHVSIILQADVVLGTTVIRSTVESQLVLVAFLSLLSPLAVAPDVVVTMLVPTMVYAQSSAAVRTAELFLFGDVADS